MLTNQRLGSFSVTCILVGVCLGNAVAQNAPAPKYPNFPSEIPAQFKPVTDSFDHTRREVMIPMRDGVRLHTVILVPKGAKGAPILLTRTPYNADNLTGHANSTHLGPVLCRIRELPYFANFASALRLIDFSREDRKEKPQGAKGGSAAMKPSFEFFKIDE